MKPLFLIIISQLLLISSVSAYSVTNGTHSYNSSLPYVNTYYNSLVTVSNVPRTVTIECTENTDNFHNTPGVYYTMVYRAPTCHSLTGESGSNYSVTSSEFSGVSNYRCVTYYTNNQCLVYRYDTTYTPPQAYSTVANKVETYSSYENTSASYTQIDFVSYSQPYRYNYYQYPIKYSWSTYGVNQ